MTRVQMSNKVGRKTVARAIAGADRYTFAQAQPQDPLETFAQITDRIRGLLGFAAREVDKLDGDSFWYKMRDAQYNLVWTPNKWVQLERELRKELTELLVKTEQLGIADRLTRVQEAQATEVFKLVLEACEAVGLERKQITALGNALRTIVNERNGIIEVEAAVA